MRVSGAHQSPLSLPCTAGTDVSMETCCADGHRVATQHRDCSLPYTSESKECRYVVQGPLWCQDDVRSEESGGERGSVC